MKNEIVIIEPKNNVELGETAVKTWHPIFEKIDLYARELTKEQQLFICKYAHYLAAFENSKITNSNLSGISVLDPAGNPHNDIKSIIPFAVSVMIEVIYRISWRQDIKLKFHTVEMPGFSYLNLRDGKLIHAYVKTLNVNFNYPILREVGQETNYQDLQEIIFKEKVITSILEVIENPENTDLVVSCNSTLMSNVATENNSLDLNVFFNFTFKYICLNRNSEEIQPENSTFKSESIKTSTILGHWQVGGPTGISIYLSKKPNRFTRFIGKLLLDMIWVDKANDTTGPLNG